MTNVPAQFRSRSTARSAAAQPLDCGELRATLWEYLDGELENGAAASVRSHLNECRSCADLHDATRAFLRTIAGVRTSDPASDALRERVTLLLRNGGVPS